MTTQPEALRLADELDSEFVKGRISNHCGRSAAAELRRLHAENEALRAQAENARALAQPVCDLLGISILHDAPKAIEALRAALEQPGVAEHAGWQFRWTNPGNHLSVVPSDLEWRQVECNHCDTVEEEARLLASQTFGGQPIYEVRSVYTAPQPAQKPVPKDCDVRKILMAVVPGPDGMSREVYAKNISDVVDKLTEMDERLEAFETAALQPAQQPEADKLLRQALEALIQSKTTVPYEGFGNEYRTAKREHEAAITAIRKYFGEKYETS